MSFLEDFQALKKSIPVPAVVVSFDENCEYVDYTHRSKNCLYCFGVLNSENALYCSYGAGRNMVDCDFAAFCESCYECVSCNKCYGCTYVQNCNDCRNCHFCALCVNCSDCFGCVALTHKQYCIFNKQYTKEEYFKEIEKLKKEQPKIAQQRLQNLLRGTPQPESHQYHNVNCPYGDFLNNSKNVYWGFDTFWLEDSGYVYMGGLARHCWDMVFGGGGGKDGLEVATEYCYEVAGAGNCYHCFFIEQCNFCTNCYHCAYMKNCSDCFGCVGLTNKQYCILNNQLTKEEYEKAIVAIRRELGWKSPRV